MNKALAMILAALAFAAFAVDTNRVTMTRLGSLNPRSGEVVTDVTFEGLADAANVYTKAETEEKIVELAPAPGNYAAVSNAAMNAASRVSPTITDMIKIVGYGNANWELSGSQTGWYFTDPNGNAYRIELNSDSNNTSNDVGSASNVLLASRKWVDDRCLPKTGGTVTGALTVQENLTVGSGSATGENSVAEGFGTAEGDYSHAEGHNTRTTVYGIDAHAEGSSTTANGHASHAEGGGTTANGEYSHVEGEDTTAQNVAEHAQGRFNASHKSSVTFGDAGNTLSSIGFGTADSTRTNAVETMQDGKTFIYGLGGYDGTNPTNGVKDLVAAIGGKADAADIPEWAKAPTKPTYTASEVGALPSAGGTLFGNLTVESTGEKSEIRAEHGNEYIALQVKDNKATIETSDYSYTMPNSDGTVALTKNIPNVPEWALAAQKPTYTASEVGATSPEAVSNIVSTAYVRKTLGVWMEYDEATGFYYYCHEEE